jgi:hypothetical protein
MESNSRRRPHKSLCATQPGQGTGRVAPGLVQHNGGEILQSDHFADLESGEEATAVTVKRHNCAGQGTNLASAPGSFRRPARARRRARCTRLFECHAQWGL